MQNSSKQRSTSTSSSNTERMYGVPFAPMPEAEAEPIGAAAGSRANGAKTGAAYQTRTAGIAEDLSTATVRTGAPDEAHKPFKLKAARYRKIIFFFGLLFARIIMWEVFIRRLAGERFAARGRPQRWRHYSRGFRHLAMDMGGVMIKLGQFVSSRVDVLPPEITEELEGLQDQIPVVSFDYIEKTIEREIGPIKQHFAWLNQEPVAAASFGQVHRGQLLNGDRVVVKVQRPNLNDLVHTDLAALDVVGRISMYYGPIRRRANVPELLDEFARVLWEELDYMAEADHALTFASMFESDPVIYIPAVYLPLTTHLVLTLEDVTSIKLNDYKALERAGINRKEVAKRLLDAYLRQVFDDHYFHADPHPGNIFVYPLPDALQVGRGPGNRAFYLIFIDFGMVGRLTPRLHEGLRETLIAVATQDAKALVASYQKLGVLLPSANVERVEEATQRVFSKVWGLNMSEMANMPFEEMAEVAREFSDLLLSMPFQMPQDFIYLSRAVGILSGMCTGLDPQFDPWREMQPFTQKLLSQSSDRTKTAVGAGPINGATLSIVSKAVREFLVRVYKLPTLGDTVLTRASEGKLEVRMSPNDPLQKQITRIEATTNQIAIGIVFATLTLASTLLFVNHEQGLGIAGYGVSAITLIMLLLRGRG